MSHSRLQDVFHLFIKPKESDLFHARIPRRTLENASNARGGFYLILNYLV